MSITSGKMSNYIGQAKDNQKLSDYLIVVDKDLQNIWWLLNTLLKFTGINSAQLITNTDVGFNYMSSMYNNPQATPTNYTGHTAFVFCTSDSSLRIYNTSDTSWKLEYLT